MASGPIYILLIWQSYNALHLELVVLAASTLNNMWQKEYSLAVDANKKQLPLRNKVSFALDRWTSMKKQAITSITA